MNAYEDLVGKCYRYIDTIHILVTGHFSINSVHPNCIGWMITQVERAILQTNPAYELVIKRTAFIL